MASAGESFADKLERLFRSVRREDGKAYTKAEVAEAIGTSRGYLHDLLSGKYEPGYALVVNLANFFQVDLEYFANSQKSQELSWHYELVSKLGEGNFRNLATRYSQLSPEGLRSVMEYLEFHAERDRNQRDYDDDPG